MIYVNKNVDVGKEINDENYSDDASDDFANECS